jgi:hypothetical protein
MFKKRFLNIGKGFLILGQTFFIFGKGFPNIGKPLKKDSEKRFIVKIAFSGLSAV